MSIELEVALIGVFGALFGSVVSSALSSKIGKENSAYDNHFYGTNKANDAISDYLITTLDSINNKNVKTMFNKFRTLQKNGLFGFSQDTIRQWNRMSNALRQHDYENAMIEYAKVILQIRKDIGYKENLKPEEILSFLRIEYLKSGIKQ